MPQNHALKNVNINLKTLHSSLVACPPHYEVTEGRSSVIVDEERVERDGWIVNNWRKYEGLEEWSVLGLYVSDMTLYRPYSIRRQARSVDQYQLVSRYKFNENQEIALNFV